MLNILIVEDELFEQRALKNQLLNKYSKVHIYLAESVQKSINIINSSIIDIIILDIQLLNENGLRIARYVYDNFKYIDVIIMSAYNEFEYAQEAMHYNVRHYLTKPVRPITIENIIDKLIDEKKKRNETDSIFYRNIDDPFGSKYPNSVDIVVACLKKEKIFTENIYKIIKSYLNENEIIKINKNIVIFMSNKKINVDDLKTLSKIIKDRYYIDIIFGLSFSQEENIIYKYKKALYACRHKVFYPEQKVIIYDKLYFSRYKIQYKITREMIVSLMKANDSKYMDKFLDELIDMSRNNFYVLESFFDSFINTIKQICIENNHYPKEIFLNKELKFWFDKNELKYKLKNIIKIMCTNINNSKSNNNSLVNEAIKIIEDNYYDKLSLINISNQLGINSSYFSRIFKENIGVSYKEYIINFRIEKSTKLLIDTNLTIKEIAKSVGFNDSNYFSKVFNDQKKMTPTKYRELYRINIS